VGADQAETLLSMNNLAAAYQAAGKLDLALPLLQEAAAGMEKRRFQHQYAGPIVDNLSDCHEQMQQFDQAEVWRRKWLAVVKERAGADSLPYAGKLAALGVNLLQQKEWTDAEAALRECLAIREKKQPESWSTFNAKCLLGGALLGQARSASKAGDAETLARAAGWYREAEPLLLAGYEGMKAREKTIPPQGRIRLTEALDRLIQLYAATNKRDELKKWQTERAKYPEPKPADKK
jgi:hypothetical protein